MKRARFSYGFISLLIIVFFMIILTGFLINRKLKNSVDEITVVKNPEFRISICKTIYRQLLETENLCYAYNLTKEKQHLTDYYDVSYEITKKTNALLSKNKDFKQRELIDSFVALVNEKRRNVSLILILQNQYRVNETLEMIQSKTDKLKEFQQQTEDKTEKAEEKRFRLFSKNKKDKTTPSKENQQKSNQEISKRNYEIMSLKSDLEYIKQIEGQKEISNNRREYELIVANRAIMSKLLATIQKLEVYEREKLAKQSVKAKNASQEIKLITSIFSILSILVLLTAIFFIIRFIIKNNEYKRYLKDARDESEKLAEAKAKFLATMSHEIRTPLNAIIGFSEQLNQKNHSDKQTQEQINIIHNSASYLSKIINDVLDYSKIEFDKMTLHESEFELAEEIAELNAILSNSFLEKNNELIIELQANSPKLLMGDVIKFKQILFNLLGNANKFTENGTITLKELSSTQKNGIFFFQFQISDTGIGISNEFISKIFNEFEQDIGNQNKTQVGTGLGLAICKKMVDLMGGSIEVQSEIGKGTSFTLELPFKFAANENKKTPSTETKVPTSPKQILVVDDELYNRKLMRVICEKLNCVIFEAENGQEALEKIQQKSFDLVFIDMKMPGMSGFELVELLRKKEIPARLIALTASQLSESEKQAFDDFVLKPIDEQKVADCLTNKIEPLLVTEKMYDLDELRKMSQHDEHFFKEMLETFIRSTKEGMAALNLANGKGDRKEISDQAHKISAPCKHLKANEIYGILKKLERNEKELMDFELQELILELNMKVELLNLQLQQEI